MSDCKNLYEELTHDRDVVLGEDLSALQRMDERTRIERYNRIKADEETFLWEFTKDCPDFFTEGEQARVRSEFRLARLLIAASFYADDSLPAALADDFIQAELEAVVDFDRYKSFDALSEEQIRRRIRRMEGEVYDLVREYHSTQLANLDELLEDPEVQQDVIERLVDRYDDRFEKVRQGFYAYVESHGLEHMVDVIEEAIGEVANAEAEREAVREEYQSSMETLVQSIGSDLRDQQEAVESRLRSIERALAGESATGEDLASTLEDLDAQRTQLAENEASLVEELNDRIEQTETLQRRLESKIDDLRAVESEIAESEPTETHEDARTVVESEIEQLHEQRDELEEEIRNLQRRRERVAAATELTQERYRSLRAAVDDATSDDTDDRSGDPEDGLSASDLVSAETARLFEMDYLGRFDTSMHEVERIRTPDGAFEVPDGHWTTWSEERSERNRVRTLIGWDEDPDLYPQNRRSRYELASSRWLGLGLDIDMVIEALVYSHLEAYAENGFDAVPADLTDLLAIVTDTVEEANDRDQHHLLAIASPTGWTEQVKTRLENEELARTHLDRRVSVCLVDLQDGTVIYDETDEIARENADLFEPPTDDERVQECIETIRSRYIDSIEHDSVLLTQLVEDHDYSQRVVKKAFNRLEGDGTGEQLYLNEFGLSLAWGES